MTHVSVRAPCGARVAGLMFLSIAPLLRVWTDLGRGPIIEVFYVPQFPSGSWAADAPFPFQWKRALAVFIPPFSYTFIDKPAP